MTAADPVETTATAQRLRSLHRAGDPLVLVNAWDAASARHVEAAGGQAIATSSAAIAASLGFPDDHTAPVAIVFDAIARIARVVTVPVTADLFDGYGLAPAELVDRLLSTGAVGCNLEDSDHSRPGQLLDPVVAAARLADVRVAALESGSDVVINARIDTYLHSAGADSVATWSHTVQRARLYLEAGADCVYPIRMTDPSDVARLATELHAPINANVGPGASVADLATAGASRVSLGPRAHRIALAALDGLASELLARGQTHG